MPESGRLKYGGGAVPGRAVLNIQQPALPLYRVPLFNALAQFYDLRVVHGVVPSLPNVVPAAFKAEVSKGRSFGLMRRVLQWDGAQLRLALGDRSAVNVLSWNFNFLSLLPALVIARVRRVPTILWGHGYSKNERWWRQFLRIRLARLATCVLLYDETTATRLRDRELPSNRVFVAPNAIDERPVFDEAARWSDASVEDFRRLNRVQSPTILFVSRLEAANRVDVLIQATGLLKRSHPGTTVIIIGEGPARAGLEELARALNLGESIRFPGGIYDESRLAPWFRGADVFCYPANAGLSIIHSFCYGLPVIIGDESGSHNPEAFAVVDGCNGLRFEHGSASALAAAVISIIEDPRRHQVMRANARETILKSFTLARMVTGFRSAVDYARSFASHSGASESLSTDVGVT